jgi:tRNA pseudouridine55 synthase
MLRILNIDKPVGWTSFDVVRFLRRHFQEKKAGHLGTLDPLASGVLPVFLGKATKLISLFNEQDKVYRATLRFGVRTDTFDAEGQILEERDASQLTEHQVLRWLQTHEGWQEQATPAYSAVKINGVPAYELARRGHTVETKSRRVCLEALRLERFTAPDAEITVHCSKGTYIRALAEQIGQDLGVGAHLIALRRLGCGLTFQIEDAISPDELAQHDSPLIDPARVLQTFPKLQLSPADRGKIAQGQAVRVPSPLPQQTVSLGSTTNDWYQVGDETPEIWALGCLRQDAHGYLFQPNKVLI